MMVRLLAAGNNPLLISQVAETLKVMARNHEKNKTAILKAGGTKVRQLKSPLSSTL